MTTRATVTHPTVTHPRRRHEASPALLATGALAERRIRHPVGRTVAVTFDTRWGTLDLDNLFRTGSGTFTVTSEVLPPLVIGMVGAKAGVPADMSLGTAQIIVAGQVVGAG
ncbi:MAG: hypothetical protein JNJ59_14130, partial [Deltaproteobacteria bacterium]|nr:hypothetical protein [Deltaproteobacteria bacterium]